jgi:signal transduction histidine kinase
VLVEYTEEELRVQVIDTGGRPGGSAGTDTGDGGNGRGLLGLRERLAVHGGTLQAGPRLAGGYRVDARIPLPAAA